MLARPIVNSEQLIEKATIHFSHSKDITPEGEFLTISF
jgi:hypothetical protein